MPRATKMDIPKPCQKLKKITPLMQRNFGIGLNDRKENL
jgi:hypothetical protein